MNVRKEPSTDADRIGKLDPGASVEYLRDYDDTWAVIKYNGQEAYVAKEFLQRQNRFQPNRLEIFDQGGIDQDPALLLIKCHTHLHRLSQRLFLKISAEIIHKFIHDRLIFLPVQTP